MFFFLHSDKFHNVVVSIKVIKSFLAFGTGEMLRFLHVQLKIPPTAYITLNVESGIELLARLKKKPSLRGLEDTLFPKGVRGTDIVEINGARSSGKTLLLSQMLGKCILPNSREIKGCNASAVLINTDHHFQVSKLVEWMSDIARNAFTSDGGVEVDEIVENSLRNLHVVDCYDSEQFAVTLRTLDDTFAENGKIALLAIDSVTAYYWQDREDNLIAIDAYAKNLLQLVKTHTARFNVATIYTKLYKNRMDDKGKKLADDINYRIHLSENATFNRCNWRNFTCTLETRQIGVRKIGYSILSNGIKWRRMDEK